MFKIIFKKYAQIFNNIFHQCAKSPKFNDYNGKKTIYSNLFSSIYFILKFIKSCEINMYTGENENHIFKKV